jgi:hypothetical protein
MNLLKATGTAVVAGTDCIFFFGPFNAGDLIRRVFVSRILALYPTDGNVPGFQRIAVAMFQERPSSMNEAAFAGGYQLVAGADNGPAYASASGIRWLAVDGDHIEIPIREVVGNRRVLGVFVEPVSHDLNGVTVMVDAEPDVQRGGWIRP